VWDQKNFFGAGVIRQVEDLQGVFIRWKKGELRNITWRAWAHIDTFLGAYGHETQACQQGQSDEAEAREAARSRV
jgi:hypothetical protein